MVPVDTLVVLELDVTLDEDSFPSGREIKSLSSSPQAASIIVLTRIPSQKYRISPPEYNLIIAYFSKKKLSKACNKMARLVLEATN